MDIDQLGAVRFWPLKMYLINDWHILKIRILFSTMMNDKLSLVSFFVFIHHKRSCRLKTAYRPSMDSSTPPSALGVLDVTFFYKE